MEHCFGVFQNEKKTEFMAESARLRLMNVQNDITKLLNEADKMYNFIFNQYHATQRAVEDYFDELRNNLLTNKLVYLERKTLFDHLRNETNCHIGALIKRIETFDTMNESEAPDDGEKLLSFRDHLNNHPYNFKILWSTNLIVSNWEAFVPALVSKIKNMLLNRVPEKEWYEIGFKRAFERYKSTHHVGCIGCPKACPYCGAKCNQEFNHSGNHSTHLHFPQAFKGCTRPNTGKLVVDVCNSKMSNQACWYYDSKFSQVIRDYAPTWISDVFVRYSWKKQLSISNKDWSPIDDTQFDKARVYKMIEAYFDKGLQDMLIQERFATSGKKQCSKAHPTDVGCQEQAGYKPRQQINGKQDSDTDTAASRCRMNSKLALV